MNEPLTCRDLIVLLARRDLRAAHIEIVRAHADLRGVGAPKAGQDALFSASHWIGRALKQLERPRK